MEQILEESYMRRPKYWQQRANELGGLEICNDETGQPEWILYPENGRLQEW